MTPAAPAGPSGCHCNTAAPSADAAVDGGPTMTEPRQALLLRHAELAAEAQQQQWQRHMSKRPPTPGASQHCEHNIFADNSPREQPIVAVTGDSSRPSSEPSRPPAELLVDKHTLGSDSSSSTSSSFDSPAVSVAKQALLRKHQPGLLAAEQELTVSGPRPPTPSIPPSFSIFKDSPHQADPVRGAQSATSFPPAAATQSVSSEQHIAALCPSAREVDQASDLTVPQVGGAAGALVLLNPDLVLDQQQQWDMKLSRRPPTPAATLGKPFNVFADDGQDSVVPAGCQVTSTAADKAVVAALRSGSPDQTARHGNSSSSGHSSKSPPAATAGTAGTALQRSTSPQSTLRPGSSNPGRQRGSSPLRNVSTVAGAGAGRDTSASTRSPLRHRSSMSDPDPTRCSPLGRSSSRARLSGPAVAHRD